MYSISDVGFNKGMTNRTSYITLVILSAVTVDTITSVKGLKTIAAATIAAMIIAVTMSLLQLPDS